MYLPMLTDARVVNRYKMGPYLAVVLTDCKSGGMIAYRHVVMVYTFEPEPGGESRPRPILAVAAEESEILEDHNACFLGIFPGDGHLNLGHSTDWADLDKFTTKALEIIASHLHTTDPPFLIPESGNTELQ
jgi:hypothetical protein